MPLDVFVNKNGISMVGSRHDQKEAKYKNYGYVGILVPTGKIDD